MIVTGLTGSSSAGATTLRILTAITRLTVANTTKREVGNCICGYVGVCGDALGDVDTGKTSVVVGTGWFRDRNAVKDAVSRLL